MCVILEEWYISLSELIYERFCEYDKVWNKANLWGNLENRNVGQRIQQITWIETFHENNSPVE